MKYYRMQVRYAQLGEIKSVVAKLYGQSARDVAIQVVRMLDSKESIAFNVNEYDWIVLKREDVLNIAVVAGD